MRPTHKTFFWLQILILIFMIGFCFYPGISQNFIFGCMSAVFLTEFVLLEQQNHYKSEEIYYKKSCLFAFLDLIFVLAFCSYFILILSNVLFGKSFYFDKNYFIGVLVYTVIRKLIIYKNYTHVKS